MARVLVVEGSPTVVSSMELTLCQRNHEVYVARDELSALAAMRALVPDLVLLDILLPHVSGYELCAMIRKLPAHSPVPVVMMSGLTDQADIQHAWRSGPMPT